MEEQKVETPKEGRLDSYTNAVLGKSKFWLGAALIVGLIIGVSIILSVLMGLFGASETGIRNTLSVWYWVSILGVVPVFAYNQVKNRKRTVDAT